MDIHVLMGLIVVTPIAILTLLRVNAATAFLALCLGNVLGIYVAHDAIHLMRGYIAPHSQLAESIVSLVLLWLPVVVTAGFMMQTISKKQRLPNLLPALAVGLLGLLLSEPFLTPALQRTIEADKFWNNLVQYQAIMVAAGTVVSLVMLRMRKKADDGHKGKHH